MSFASIFTRTTSMQRMRLPVSTSKHKSMAAGPASRSDLALAVQLGVPALTADRE